MTVLAKEDCPTWHLDALPILKWPGGKRSLLPRILERLPARCDRFVEPMVGAGAVFFAYGPNAQACSIADINPDLITTYNAVAEDPDVVYRELAKLAEDHRYAPLETYVGVRDLFNAKDDDPFMLAAQMLYLNKACFNGLWRVNNEGKFNVPIGKRANGTPHQIKLPAWDDFRAAAGRLALADIQHADFRSTLGECGEGDVVYVDPPYPGGFDDYAAGGFPDEEHYRLAGLCQQAADNGAFVLVSIGDNPLSREVYAEHEIEVTDARGSIGAKAERRGRRGELLITIRARR